MIKTATLAGKEYPVSFGNAALALFERETGVSIATIGEDTPYFNTLRLIWCGMRDGGRKAGKPFLLEFEAFCDLLDEDADAVQRLMDVFTESMPVPADGEKKAKAKARR